MKKVRKSPDIILSFPDFSLSGVVNYYLLCKMYSFPTANPQVEFEQNQVSRNSRMDMHRFAPSITTFCFIIHALENVD